MQIANDTYVTESGLDWIAPDGKTTGWHLSKPDGSQLIASDGDDVYDESADSDDWYVGEFDADGEHVAEHGPMVWADVVARAKAWAAS